MRFWCSSSMVCVMVLCVLGTAASSTIPQIKMLGDGNPVTLSGKAVTYAGDGFFYVQEATGVGGIRVHQPSHTVRAGMAVDLAGAVMTNSCSERYIEATSVTQNSSGRISPCFLVGNSVGGSDWNHASSTGQGQAGVTNGTGLNNVGLLIRTAGRISYVSPDRAFAYLDDGSKAIDNNDSGVDGAAVPGLRLILPDGVSIAPVGTHMDVTGVSCITTVKGERARAILARSYLGEMVYIPPGTFLMGNSDIGDDAVYGHSPSHYTIDEDPQHEVTITSGYWLAKYEVTRGDYRQFINAGGYDSPEYWSVEGWSWKVGNAKSQPYSWEAEQIWNYVSRPGSTFVQTERHPVVGVSYYEAQAFCRWAGGRLPTEAEWEKAARWDGSPRVYPWGNSWHWNKCNDFSDPSYPGNQTSPVGSYPLGASPGGLLDMAGNVWEWCSDWYDDDYYASTPIEGWVDPQGPPVPNYRYRRVLRGGSWAFGNVDARCSNRYGCPPGSFGTYYVGSGYDIGIRIVR